MKYPLSTYAMEALRHAAEDPYISNRSRPVDIQITIYKRFERFALQWQEELQFLLKAHCTVRVSPLQFLDPTMQEIFESLELEKGVLVADNGNSSVGLGYDLKVHFYPLYVTFADKVYLLPENIKELVILIHRVTSPSLDMTNVPLPSFSVETIIRGLAFGVGYPLLAMKPEQKLLDTITIYAVDWIGSGKAQEERKLKG